MKLRELRQGQTPTVTEWNELIRAVRILMNMRGVDGVKVTPAPNGITVSGDPNTLFRPRNAFPINAAPSSSSILCYLDTDSAGGTVPGPQVTVQCEIAGGSTLNNAITRLEDGTRLTVWNDNGTWRPFYPFQATSDCP